MEVHAPVSDCDRLGKSSLSAMLGYAQSEYSLGTSTGPIISREQAHHPAESSEADGNATDEEVEICITRLNFYPDHAKRLYMDCQLSLPAGRIQMRGGAEAILPPEAESGDDSLDCSPEMRYERLRSTVVEQQRHWRLLKQAFECPLSQCPAKVTASDLLSHCLVDHPEIITLELRAERPISLKLLGPALPEAQAKSHCVGLLIFDSPRRVAMNWNLPRVYSDWEGRPPILIMLWKTSWDSKTVTPLVTHLYILWLLCPQAQPALMVNVRVKDSREFRKLITTCPNPQLLEESDLLSDSPLFMRFTHPEMKDLTKNYSQDIQLEFTIKENEQDDVLEQDLPERQVLRHKLDRKRHCSSHFDNFDIDIEKKMPIEIDGKSEGGNLSNSKRNLLEETTSTISKENIKETKSEALITSERPTSEGSSEGSSTLQLSDDIRSKESLDLDLGRNLEDERLQLIPVGSRGNIEIAEAPDGHVYYY